MVPTPKTTPNWFQNAFGSQYRIAYSVRNEAAAEAEIRFLVGDGLLALGGLILDLACGHGRHGTALANLGAIPVGVDLSEPLLQEAPAGLRGTLVRGDMRHLPLQRGCLDGCVSLFSSFGYFSEEAEHGAVLCGLARALKPGAPFFLDLMNPSRVRRGLVPESTSMTAGCEIRERRWLSPDGKRVLKAVEVRPQGGNKESWQEDVRLFEPGEIRDLLAECGFEYEQTHGDFEGAAFGPDSPRQLIRARVSRSC